MTRKHDRTDDNDIQPGRNELQPPRRVKRDKCKAEDVTSLAQRLTPEQFNRRIVDQGLIYGERLEARTARILVLRPGSTMDEIKCDLIQKIDLTQASLGEVSPYEAVSYVWGEEENPDFIVLCGCRFAVTRNLAEALRYLRYPGSNRLLWVDAICINQYDEEEKEAQVMSMHRIYQFAKRVIAWLGPPDEYSGLAYSVMILMQKRHIKSASAVITSQVSKEGVSNEDDAFRMLMRRPYWTRAWIVQEMMSAQSLVIQCGSAVVPYARLEESHPSDAPAYFQSTSGDSKAVRTDFHGDSEVEILRIESEKISPERFLDCFLDRECRERRDNIFAFRNLFSDDIQRKIRVCYKTDIRKLVRITARAIIKSTQSLHIIIIKGRQTPPSVQGDEWQLDMPSWCPYLATPYECSSVRPQNEPSLFAEKAMYSFVNNRLRVRGFAIGRVSQTISRQQPHKLEATTWWDEVDIEREQHHYWKCLALGRHGLPKDKHTLQMSIAATTLTLLAGRGDRVADVEMLLETAAGIAEGPALLALRSIWNNGKSRLVCSFQLSRRVTTALYSSKEAPATWINRVALVPRTVRRGDVICMILGCTTPVVLRKVEKRYYVLGEAYIDTSTMGSFNVAVKLRDFVLE
jgi:hypothetical protein